MTLVRNQLDKLKALQSNYKVAKIIVSGGSSRHPIFRDFLESECKALGIEIQPFYMNRIGREYEYARLALGASYATTKTPSVKQFLASASFGLRVKATWKTYDGQDMHDWSKDALLMWFKGSVDVYNTSANGDEAEIACQANVAALEGTVYLPHRNPTYQILLLLNLPRGKFHFRLMLKPEEEDMTLILLGEISTPFSLSGMDEPRYPVLASATFPVTVWAGCRALTIYDDHEETRLKITNLLSIAGINYTRVRNRLALLTDEEARQLRPAPVPAVATNSASAQLAPQDRDEDDDEEMADV